MEGEPVFDAPRTKRKNTKDSAAASGHSEAKKPKNLSVRGSGAERWVDKTMVEWDPNDYRIFCGNLGNDVTDEMLLEAFSKYSSITKTRVVRDKHTGKSKGYGFASFRHVQDFIAAMKEMDGKYIGSRPVKLSKSTWQKQSK